jgi:CRISPR/Cas system-associated endonuclease/helicase Cas3
MSLSYIVEAKLIDREQFIMDEADMVAREPLPHAAIAMANWRAVLPVSFRLRSRTISDA